MKKMMYTNDFRLTGLWVMLFFLAACRPNLEDHSQSSTAYLFHDPEVLVQSISIQSKSGDEVDFILKKSSWVNKDNQSMNASFADEMLEVLLSATFEPVKESQEVTARKALRDKGLRVTVDWADGTQKTFYLVTAFDPSKTFVCFASDDAMEGALHQAWVSDAKKKVTRDFTSVFDPSMAEFGAESMRDRSILSMEKPLEQIQRIDVVFYDSLGRPNDESYVLDWVGRVISLSDGDYSIDTLRARSYIRDFASIQVQRYHPAFADQEQVRVNDKFVSLAVHSLTGSIWVLHVYRMPCTPSLGCPDGEYVSDQYFGEVEGQSSWFELQDFAFMWPMVKPASFFLPSDKK